MPAILDARVGAVDRRLNAGSGDPTDAGRARPVRKGPFLYRKR
jgi:hypothetical protein